MTIGTLTAHLGVNTTGLMKAERTMGRFVKRAGRSLMSLRSLAGGVFVGLATRKVLGSFMAYESALTDMAKVTSLSMEDINDSIRSLPATLGDATELTKGFYQVISAGVTEPAKAMETLVTASKAAKASHVGQSEVIKALTKLMAGFKGEIDSVSSASDLLFKIEKEGQTSFQELVPVIGSLANLSSTLAVNAEEMGAALATVSQTAGSTAEATTQLQGIYSGLIRQMPEMTVLLEKLGFETAQQAIKSMGFIDFLKEMEKHTGGSAVKLAELVGTRKEAILAFSALASQGFQPTIDRIKSMEERVGATQGAFERWAQSLEGVWVTFKATVGNLFIELGRAFGEDTRQMLLSFTKSIQNNFEGIISTVRTVADVIGGLWNLLTAFPVTVIDDLRRTREELDKFGAEGITDDLDVLFEDIKKLGSNFMLVMEFALKAATRAQLFFVKELIIIYEQLWEQLKGLGKLILGVFTLDKTAIRKALDGVVKSHEDAGKRSLAVWSAFSKGVAKDWKDLTGDVLEYGTTLKTEQDEINDKIKEGTKMTAEMAQAAIDAAFKFKDVKDEVTGLRGVLNDIRTEIVTGEGFVITDAEGNLIKSQFEDIKSEVMDLNSMFQDGKFIRKEYWNALTDKEKRQHLIWFQEIADAQNEAQKQEEAMASGMLDIAQTDFGPLVDEIQDMGMAMSDVTQELAEAAQQSVIFGKSIERAFGKEIMQGYVGSFTIITGLSKDMKDTMGELAREGAQNLDIWEDFTAEAHRFKQIQGDIAIIQFNQRALGAAYNFVLGDATARLRESEMTMERMLRIMDEQLFAQEEARRLQDEGIRAAEDRLALEESIANMLTFIHQERGLPKDLRDLMDALIPLGLRDTEAFEDINLLREEFKHFQSVLNNLRQMDISEDDPFIDKSIAETETKLRKLENEIRKLLGEAAKEIRVEAMTEINIDAKDKTVDEIVAELIEKVGHGTETALLEALAKALGLKQEVA